MPKESSNTVADHLLRIWWEMTRGRTRLVKKDDPRFPQDPVFLPNFIWGSGLDNFDAMIKTMGLALLSATEETFPAFATFDKEWSSYPSLYAMAQLAGGLYCAEKNETSWERYNAACTTNPELLTQIRTRDLLNYLMGDARHCNPNGNHVSIITAANEIRRRAIYARKGLAAPGVAFGPTVFIHYRRPCDPRLFRLRDLLEKDIAPDIPKTYQLLLDIFEETRKATHNEISGCYNFWTPAWMRDFGEETETQAQMKINKWIHTICSGGDLQNYVGIDLTDEDSPLFCLPSLPDPIPDEYRTTKLLLRRIPAGSFMMGSPRGEFGRQEDELQHRVTVTRDFYIGVFPVTGQQWDLIMGNSINKKATQLCPVDKLSYNNLSGVLERLRNRTKLDICLPSEAQWEYACRAGTTTALNSDCELTHETPCRSLAAVGCYLNSVPGGPVKVGSYRPNAWGLYDMHGNVYEWCSDWYGDYNGPVATNPAGPLDGTERVIRGGCWKSQAPRCRSAARNHRPPDHRGTEGFRIVFNPLYDKG